MSQICCYLGPYIKTKSERRFDIINILEKYNFENEFYLWNFNDYTVILPNKQQCGIRIKNEGTYSINNASVTSFLHPDWAKIQTIFEQEQIDFEQDIGVVYYYD